MTPAARRALGATFVVRSDDPALTDLMDSALSPYPIAKRADHEVDVVRTGSGLYRVLADGLEIDEVETAGDAVEVVVSHLNHLAITSTPDRLLFHAGVAARGGTAVVVVGPSGRGKSTLTAALVRSGFEYLSDEVAAIDPATRWVEPFPKPLSLSGPTLDLLGLAPVHRSSGDDGARDGGRTRRPGKTPLLPSRIGSVSGGAVLGLIVLLHDPDPSASLLAGGEAPAAPPEVTDFLMLLEQTFAPSMRVNHSLERLGHMFTETPVLNLQRRDVDSMVREVAAALAVAAHAPL